MFNNYDNFIDECGQLNMTNLAEQACDSTDGYGEYNPEKGYYDIPEKYFEYAFEVQEQLVKEKLVEPII